MQKKFYGFSKESAVSMMTIKKKFLYRETTLAQVLRMEYVNSKMSALIILPKESKNFMAALSQGNI